MIFCVKLHASCRETHRIPAFLLKVEMDRPLRLVLLLASACYGVETLRIVKRPELAPAWVPPRAGGLLRDLLARDSRCAIDRRRATASRKLRATRTRLAAAVRQALPICAMLAGEADETDEAGAEETLRVDVSFAEGAAEDGHFESKTFACAVVSPCQPPRNLPGDMHQTVWLDAVALLDSVRRAAWDYAARRVDGDFVGKLYMGMSLSGTRGRR